MTPHGVCLCRHVGRTTYIPNRFCKLVGRNTSIPKNIRPIPKNLRRVAKYILTSGSAQLVDTKFSLGSRLASIDFSLFSLPCAPVGASQTAIFFWATLGSQTAIFFGATRGSQTAIFFGWISCCQTAIFFSKSLASLGPSPPMTPTQNIPYIWRCKGTKGPQGAPNASKTPS